MKTLVLGLGNSILSDDGVGLYVVQELAGQIFQPDVTLQQTELGGINLLEMLIGFEKVIIIDAVKTGKMVPGEVSCFELDSLNPDRHANSTHGIDFASIIELGKKLNMNLPPEIVIYGVEVQDISTFSNHCTDSVERAIPACAAMILKEINQDTSFQLPATGSEPAT